MPIGGHTISNMKQKTVFMFSGQGSQYYHMAKSLFLSNFTFRKWMIHLNDIVKRDYGFSIIEHLYGRGKNFNDTFDNILVTHPAIFMVEYSAAKVLMELGVSPDYVWGTSLGEFTGAAIAGVMDTAEILDAIIRQAIILKNNCREGGMLSIYNDPSLYIDLSFLNKNNKKQKGDRHEWH